MAAAFAVDQRRKGVRALEGGKGAFASDVTAEKMTIPNLSDEQMHTVVKALEQAAYNHSQWAEALYGTLICRLPPDQRDMSDDAHHMCRFGQWYYKSGLVALEGHPGYTELGAAHESMHRYAASLLRETVGGVPISINDYERFLGALKRLQLELETVRHEFVYALSNLDPLTGTPSRTGMLTKLRDEQELVKREVRGCVVAMMDLDLFKAVNDQYGHAVGDKVLVGFARYIMAHLRPYDRVFRYGGEEFLICLPNTDLEMGREIIDRMCEELASLPFEAAGKGQFHVTASFGLTLLDAAAPVERSVDHADQALYVAKAKGRNGVVTWDASMDVPQDGPGKTGTLTQP
jgi:diguanylate cyclase (GGDEF)-like protein